MSTIFHKGRKILNAYVGNRNNAEVLDYAHYIVSWSKFYDKNGEQYYLIQNIDYIAEELGFSTSFCSKALSDLEKKGFIRKVKSRCNDGAVRVKLYITDYSKKIMSEIDSLVVNQRKQKPWADDLDSIHCDQSDSVENDQSILKELNKIENNNNVNKDDSNDDDPSNGYQQFVKPVNFKFSFDLAEGSEAYRVVESLAVEHQLDFSSLLMALIDLQSTDLYQSTESLVNDAVASLKRIDSKDNVIPMSYSKLMPKKAVFHAEDERFDSLTPRQQLALSQLINDLIQSGKAHITNVEEVFKWIEYQITNPIHHFVSRGFKHCMNIVKKMLCLGGNQQYLKPFGYAK